MDYVATFFSHYSAMLTKNALENKSIKVKLAPTPRSVSSSCGTCILYTSDIPYEECMDEDFEAIYIKDSIKDTYKKIVSNE